MSGNTADLVLGQINSSSSIKFKWKQNKNILMIILSYFDFRKLCKEYLNLNSELQAFIIKSANLLGGKRTLKLRIFREQDPIIKDNYDFYRSTKSLENTMMVSNRIDLYCDSLTSKVDYIQFI